MREIQGHKLWIRFTPESYALILFSEITVIICAVSLPVMEPLLTLWQYSYCLSK